MVNYILKLELNCKNKMIFAVQHHEKDIALIMYEDCRRKGELMRDFSFLYPQYYSSEKEWNDHRNLIKIRGNITLKFDKKKYSFEQKMAYYIGFGVGLTGYDLHSCLSIMSNLETMNNKESESFFAGYKKGLKNSYIVINLNKKN